jgi:signal transduction histidine kinase/phage shock protein PspC (stress-responsive transcriptional regulator)
MCSRIRGFSGREPGSGQGRDSWLVPVPCVTMAWMSSVLEPEPRVRRASRRTDGRILGGVAGGLSEHLGVEVMPVRAAFVVATAFGGLGVAMYAGLWMILPSDARFHPDAPGLEAATRQGRRPGRPPRLEDGGWLVALGAVALGAAVLVQTFVGAGHLVWPVLFGGTGLVVLWRQADEAQRERWVDATGRIDPIRAVLGRGGAASYARLVSGLVLLAVAFMVFAVQTDTAGMAGDVLVAGLLGVLGLGLTVGPWLFRLASDLAEERAARVRSQERADVAAHLHDSVLQTLALVQKHADDARTVARLARAQERELRSWLYEDRAGAKTSVAGALRDAAAEVEDAHGMPVEVVAVGAAAPSEAAHAVVLAAREAMVNAAKHSGAEQVDVYAETGRDRLEVYVRDRGRGFRLDTVPADRLGVRRSIVDRMERHGGFATIRSALGEGTEVCLSMPLPRHSTEEER